MNTAGIKTIAAAIDAVAAKAPSRLALTSPFQQVSLTYGDLSRQTNALAAWLNAYGFEKRDILVSDLPNTAENLLLQVACNRLGVHYGTAKSLESMSKQFPQVKGAVSASEKGFLAVVGLPVPVLSGDFLQDLIAHGLEEYLDEEIDDGEKETIHAYYNSTTGYTNQQALEQGADAAWELAIIPGDIVCVSVTLCHAFGIGSACTSTFLQGAAVALPAVGGIQGCGVPSERAAATLEILESQKCTLLFADTHTLKALPEPQYPLDAFRGGVVKIGSGSTFLEETRKYGGVTMRTIGSMEA
jgi:acyl-CoA synthetase (AMP-forming)/AMP-acid ligase II